MVNDLLLSELTRLPNKEYKNSQEFGGRGLKQHNNKKTREKPHTCALVTTISTSPLAALMSSPNLEHTPPRRPRRLFSARVRRKLRTVSPGAPTLFSSSAMMAPLSPAVSVGADRIVDSLGSRSTRLPSAPRALAVGSRVEVLTAAAYCLGCGLVMGARLTLLFDDGGLYDGRERGMRPVLCLHG